MVIVIVLVVAIVDVIVAAMLPALIVVDIDLTLSCGTYLEIVNKLRENKKENKKN